MIAATHKQHYLQQEFNQLINTDNRIFDFLQSSSLDGLWYWDLENMEEKWMNERFWINLGYKQTSKQKKSINWKSLINPDDFILAKKYAKQYITNPNYSYDQIVRYQHKNKRTVWMRCRGEAIRDKNGKAIRMLGTHTNITAEKEKEAQLLKNNKRLNEIISGSGDLVLILNRHLTITEYFKPKKIKNDALITKVEIGKKLSHLLLPTTVIECIEKIVDTKAINEICEDCQKLEFEIVSGEQSIWYEIALSAIYSQQGILQEIIGIIQNINRRKKNEERFKKTAKELERTKDLLEETSRLAKVGGWEVDLATSEVHWSAITKEIHQVSPDYIPNLEKGINYYKEGKSRDTITRVVNEAIETGKGWNVELQITTAKGRDIWVRAIGKAIMDGSDCKRLYGTFQDISESVDAKQKLEEALYIAQQAAKAKSTFLSNMSHEIRTPLNAVIGMTHLLINNNPRTDQIEKLKTLQFSADNLLTLVNDILDYNKLEAGNINFEVIPFNIYEITTSLKQAFAFKAEEKGIKLKVLLDPDVPTIIKGDPTRLVQVLNNLMSNALKFTEKGKVSLSIEIASENQRQVALLFEVKDTGIGISKEQVTKIFDRFAQANTTTTRKFGGTGLGLSIVKKILDMQNSEIEIESIPEKGSSFRFSLNFDKVTDSKDLSNTVLAETSINNDFFDLKGLNILLVEDNEMNQLVATEFLKSWNVTLDYAVNGLEAVEKVTEYDYDVILMDIQMPEMDGYQATIRIKQMGDSKSKIPILAMTASTLMDMSEKIKEIGMEGHILKPFNPKELNTTLAKYTFDKERIDISLPEKNIPTKSTTINFDKINQLASAGLGNKNDILLLCKRELDKFKDSYQQAIKENDVTKMKFILLCRAFS